jgi:hypothetical protein
VACPSTATCIAAAKIGSDAAGTGSDGAAEIWHPRARQWSNAGLRGANWLFGVSCVSNVHCVAISADAIYTWNGARWDSPRVPDNLDTNAPSAVTCAALTRCIVIAGSSPAISLVLRGRTWTIHPMPGVHGNNWTAFGDLSCPAANSCTAVGAVSAHNYQETTALLVEYWNGTSWRIGNGMPAPRGGDTGLSAVSCPTLLICLAVGSQGIDQIPFIERSS